MWLGVSLLQKLDFSQDKPNADIIEVQYISQEELMQIVEQDQVSINEEVPDEAKFLSAKNQKVNESTQAKSSGKFNNLVQYGSKGNKQAETSKLPKMKDLSLDNGWFTQEEEKQAKMADSKESIFASTSDHLKDIKEGKQTLLNTREFVYYSYYNRIRRQLQQYWEPSIKKKFLRLMKSGRKIASTQDRLTRVLITLNTSGNLMKVQLLEESGVRDLDDAAVEAFQDAAPFPNPPQGIIEKDDTVKIRWDFVIEA